MIRIKKMYYAYEDHPTIPFMPEFYDITKDDILEYLRQNPMPEDPEYNKEYLIHDLISSEGIFVLPDVKEETVAYIEKLINDLIERKENG